MTKPLLRFIVCGRVAKEAPPMNVKLAEPVWINTQIDPNTRWFFWDRNSDKAHPFETLKEAQEAALHSGPWYYAPDPSSIEIIEVNYTPPVPAEITRKDTKPWVLNNGWRKA